MCFVRYQKLPCEKGQFPEENLQFLKIQPLNKKLIHFWPKLEIYFRILVYSLDSAILIIFKDKSNYPIIIIINYNQCCGTKPRAGL